MRKDLYAERLATFKERERPEVLLLVANDRARIGMVIGWTNTASNRKKRLSKLTDTSDQATWAWLWDNTDFSRDELMAGSSLSEDVFEKHMKALIANRVLYPDGTVNSFVQRYLHEKVLKLFGAKPKSARGS